MLHVSAVGKRVLLCVPQLCGYYHTGSWWDQAVSVPARVEYDKVLQTYAHFKP